MVAPRAEAAKIPLVDETVREGDKVSVGKLGANVIETPGHTAGHITYWFHADKIAFAGDTLFSIGCGRVIEGTMEQMWNSLLKLRDLPGDTLVYCGHEYTLANIKFAQTDRAGQQGADRTRRAGRATGRGGSAHGADHDRRGEGGERVPARRRAVGCGGSGTGGQTGGGGVRGDQDAEE